MRVVERTQGAGEGEAKSTAVVRLEDGGTGTSRPLPPPPLPCFSFSLHSPPPLVEILPKITEIEIELIDAPGL